MDAQSVDQSTILIQTEISTTIAIKFCTNINGPQRMNHTDFGDHLIFPVAPPGGAH